VKASELIAELNKLIATHGDVDVIVEGCTSDSCYVAYQQYDKVIMVCGSCYDNL